LLYRMFASLPREMLRIMVKAKKHLLPLSPKNQEIQHKN
jgi:hypothetical protein